MDSSWKWDCRDSLQLIAKTLQLPTMGALWSSISRLAKMAADSHHPNHVAILFLN
jgi:hypothetical protein